jgi:thiamine transport system permease protein
MALRPVTITVAVVVLALTLGPVPLLLARGGGAFQAADLAALRFTVTQAGLSALMSCVLAVPVARAFARRRFVGRGFLIALMGAPFLLPVIVAILGILAIFGKRGWLAGAGLPVPSIYGMQGVVLAHVFLNLPLATRMILQGWQAIPAERSRLAAALGFSPATRLRHLEVPMLREVLPGAFLAIFLVCLTSFVIALTLGGGPRATTLELAIYQAVRFEFDLPRAALLALVQFGICGVAVLIATFVAKPAGFGAGQDRAVQPFAPGGWHRAGDIIALVLATGFLALPLAAVILHGLAGMGDLPLQVWPAVLRSVVVAVASGLLSVAAALILAQSRGRGSELIAMLPLAASSLVLGTGLFLAVYPFVSPAVVALPVTIAVSATLALPFAYRLLAPETRAVEADYGRLADALGLTGIARLRLLTLPRLRRPLGFAMGVTAALAMGDIGAIALFAGEGGATLPLLVQRLMGAYRMEAAAAAALVLLTANFAVFWAFDAWGRHDADA